MVANGFRTRLGRALQHWGGSKAEFAREMERRGVRGASYRSIKNYLAGLHTPSPKWIEEASEFLGVSAPWLKNHIGQMLDAARDAHQDDDTLTQEGLLQASLTPALYEALRQQAPWATGSFLAAWNALVQSQPDKDPSELTEEECFALGRLVGRPVNSIAGWVGGNRDDWHPREFAMYLNAVWTAVLMATPAAKQGLPLQTLLAHARTLDETNSNDDGDNDA